MKKRFIFFGCLFLAILLAYLNSLHGTWAMDDIVANQPVKFHGFSGLLGYRKVTYLTFLFNQWIAPFSPAGYRLFNIVLHFLNSILVYALCYKSVLLSTDPGDGSRAEKAFVAGIAGSLVFALHPLNINAVAYIVQRMASLAAFFVLAALLVYIRAYRASGGSRSVVLYVTSAVLLAAGVLSKENAVMGIPLILLYDYFFLSGREIRIFGRRVLIVLFIGIISLGIMSPFLNIPHVVSSLTESFLTPDKIVVNTPWTAKDAYWTPLEQVLTGFRVVSRYIFLIFLPLPRFLVFDWWGFPVSTGITHPATTLLSMIFLAGLLALAVLGRKRWPLLSFGILWYFIAISLESFMVPGLDFYFEHRNYLPLAGLFVGIAGQLALGANKRRAQRTLLFSALALAIVLGTLTAVRNSVWKDSVTLWGDTLSKTPSNLRAMMALGNAYYKISDFEDAGRYYKKTLEISSRDHRPQFFNDSAYTLGMMYLYEGKLKLAKEIIDRLGEAEETYRPRILIGFYKSLTHDLPGALKEYDSVLEEAGGLDKVVVLTLKGDAYRGDGQMTRALAAYRDALAKDPLFSAAYYGIGVAYMAERNVTEARRYFLKTLEIDPHNSLALSDMADLMLITKENPEDALAYARRAISSSSFFYQPYLTMGNVLTVMGRDKEAVEFYDKALKHGMPDYMLPFSRARAYYMKGDREKADYYISQLKKYKDLPPNIRALLGRSR